VDAVMLRKYRCPFWLTANYQPRSQTCSPQERHVGFDRIYRLILQHNTHIPPGLIEDLRLLPDVEVARAGEIAAAPLPPSQLATAASLTQPYRDNNIYLREAHLFTQGSPAVKIAVLDTGFAVDHPEIAHAMLPGKDFVDIINGAGKFIGDFLNIDDEPEDDVGHGTHVAGILAAQGSKMPIGVVPNCQLLPVKVLGGLQRGNTVVGAGLVDNINNGIKWAVDQGADVINMSLGIKHQGGGLPHEEVIRYALENGVTVVAASGNDGTQDKYYPGALPGVIAVGAADDQGQIAPFSTYGGHVSLIAPGVNVYSTFPHNGYAISSGTSQAAPFVTGAVALLKSFALSRGKPLYDNQIKFLLKHTSDKISDQFKDLKAGFGRINLLDALRYVQYKI
jgi:subtilisin family serine protease